MPEFLTLVPPAEALERLLDNLPRGPAPEQVPSDQALGRVILEPVQASLPLPSFSRSTVDGYAVKAADTFGASDRLPAYLKLAGEVLMGARPGFSLSPGSCALIHTGGMLPEGADAVVMVENTQPSLSEEVEILKSVAVGENVLRVGEDVTPGEVVIPSGVRIRPAEIGGLMALGIEQVTVARKPVAGIISSGDEVIRPPQELHPGQVYDVNTFTLQALVNSAGGVPQIYEIAPDREQALYDSSTRALQASDLVVLTAGSSVSTRDLTARVIDALGEPGVLVHGVSVRPGKPTILGVCDSKAVIGLPGNPVSALVIASLFVTPVIEYLLGLDRRPPRARLTARLDLNLSSVAGREDWIPVSLTFGEGEVRATPVFGKSNLIFSLVRADGLIRIPPEATGLEAGQLVEVHIL